MNADWMTLKVWASHHFEEVPCVQTLCRYARDGQIQPRPVLMRGVYMVPPQARFVKAAVGRGRR